MGLVAMDYFVLPLSRLVSMGVRSDDNKGYDGVITLTQLTPLIVLEYRLHSNECQHSFYEPRRASHTNTGDH
jgi:hypothetical protein